MKTYTSFSTVSVTTVWTFISGMLGHRGQRKFRHCLPTVSMSRSFSQFPKTVEGPHLISQTDMMAKLTQPIDLEYITVVFSEPKTGTLKDKPDVKYARVQVSVLNDDRTTSPLIIPTDEQNDGSGVHTGPVTRWCYCSKEKV